MEHLNKYKQVGTSELRQTCTFSANETVQIGSFNAFYLNII